MKLSIAVILCCGIISTKLQFGASTIVDTDNEFFEAVKSGNIDRVEKYLSAHTDTDLNAQDSEGTTALIISATNENEAIPKFLLERGADVNKADREGITPLFVAASNSNDKIFDAIINKGADIHHMNKHNETALIWASMNKNEKPAEELIKRGANIDQFDNLWNTPLHSASWNSNEKLVLMLIKAGADVNAVDIDGWSAAHFAVTNGHEETKPNLAKLPRGEIFARRYVLERMLDHWTTPIQPHAAHKIIEILINNGADINHKNNVDKTPYDLATKMSDEKLKELLKKHGANSQIIMTKMK